ncbi:MAG: sigma-70 family RNA polymerase sigma factor [Pirellulaceae bacterium]|jgi:RNA polymerase sigma-70 factor (ECF subfamily)|nr:sigma-70 family RNA polymerase sigma factor [Pirellulaceae bacterium]MDP7016869.1 sigma-70 family RNA polymerase sigma factor [Pirellulaceae bacterium]
MEQESVELANLLDRLQGGDERALGELFTHYRARLARIVRFRLDQRLKSRVSESDVIQDTYVTAAKRLDHFRGKEDMPIFIWLRLLVNQQLADLHRLHLQAEKRDVRKEVSIDQPAISPHTSHAIAVSLVGAMTSPSQVVARAEKIAALERVINDLNPIDREVIALRHFEELSNAETATVLGIEKQAASKRYVRAMVRLREMMDGLEAD